MAATSLGRCQVVFVTDGEQVQVDLLLAGSAVVEGQPLVAGSPLALAFDPHGASRADAVRRLERWADRCRPCEVEVRLGDHRAVVRLSRGDHSVLGELTDLDVMFVEPGSREHH